MPSARLIRLTAARRSFASGPTSTPASTFSFPNIRETGFELEWRKLNEQEKDRVEKEYMEMGKKDWHSLSFDQMRARTG